MTTVTFCYGTATHPQPSPKKATHSINNGDWRRRLHACVIIKRHATHTLRHHTWVYKTLPATLNDYVPSPRTIGKRKGQWRESSNTIRYATLSAVGDLHAHIFFSGKFLSLCMISPLLCPAPLLLIWLIFFFPINRTTHFVTKQLLRTNSRKIKFV